MRIATWNVNSVRARMPLLVEWLEARRPEVCCLQETKVVDELFPREPLEELGYEVATFGQRTYNGVAILSRVGLWDVRRGLPGEDVGEGGSDADPDADPSAGAGDAREEARPPAEARVIGATVGDVMLLNLYVINGQEVGAPRYRDKLEFLGRVAELVRSEYPMSEKIVLCGDFNVTFDDRDVYDPDKWRERILCSTPEREALAGVMEPGLADAFRRFTEEGGHYTWWDFRTRGFARNRGLRIDHFLVSPPALEAATAVTIDTEARAAQKPSDHAPVLLELD